MTFYRDIKKVTLMFRVDPEAQFLDTGTGLRGWEVADVQMYREKSRQS